MDLKQQKKHKTSTRKCLNNEHSNHQEPTSEILPLKGYHVRWSWLIKDVWFNFIPFYGEILPF